MRALTSSLLLAAAVWGATIAGVILSRSVNAAQAKAPIESITVDPNESTDFRFYRIDGCEYIVYDSWNTGRRGVAMVHKGNCSNHKVVTP